MTADWIRPPRSGELELGLDKTDSRGGGGGVG
jgi:hypothetical protein